MRLDGFTPRYNCRKRKCRSWRIYHLGHVKNAGPDNNSNEKASNNQEIGLTHKFFKEIAGIMPNIDEIHITGTGQIQEQFMKFLAETPQYKNALPSESTSNKMSDESLTSFAMKHFN